MSAAAIDVMRFHLSLNVNDLGRSVRFLAALLGCEPAKHRADYAKFEPEDLPVVLSLEPRRTPQPPLRGTAGEGALNHAGIRLADAAQLVEAQRRLEAAGYSTQREDGVECCYARQTKFWVFDHDRTMWEVYVLEEDLDHRGGPDDGHSQPHETHVAEVQASTPARIWTHRLSQEFPAEIPGAGELDEIVLQGSWNARRHVGQWARQLAAASSALRPGGKVALHFLTSQEPLADLQPLPGPASVVEVVPCLADVLAALEAAGFIDVQFVKYGSSPCFVQQGTELRETRLEAHKPVLENGSPEMVRVVFKGPAALLAYDSGNTFYRGRATAIPLAAWERLASSSLAESFVKCGNAGDSATCGITPVRPVHG